jgi:hypothetical protein
MLQSKDEARLDSLARKFRAVFQQRLGDMQPREEFTDRLVVTVPALHPETGDIVVWLDGDEVTVGIGEHFHCHFETYLDEGVPQAHREGLATERAVEFIEAFLADSIVLRVRREGGRVVSAGTHPVDTQQASPDAGETDYLWSGPSRTS